MDKEATDTFKIRKSITQYIINPMTDFIQMFNYTQLSRKAASGLPVSRSSFRLTSSLNRTCKISLVSTLVWTEQKIFLIFYLAFNTKKL